MPVIQIKSNIAFEADAKKHLLSSVARLTADVMQKPMADVMVACLTADFIMDGKIDEAAVFVDFRSLSNVDRPTARQLCEGLLNIIQEQVPVDPARVYINFFEVCGEFAWRFRDGVAVCPKSP
ncbi:MAG: phenylpyruvate tautomerase MIF-related protein [Chloroflexota bacterium]